MNKILVSSCSDVVMAAAIVDFSTESSDIFIEDVKVKELAVVDVFTLASQQWRFMKKGSGRFSQFATTFFRYCTSDCGDISREFVSPILTSATENYKLLFAPNEEKCKYLKSILNRSTVFNLENFLDVNIVDYLPVQAGTECLYHLNTNMSDECPHAHAYSLARWCKENYNRINLFDSYVRYQTFKNWNHEFLNKEDLSTFGFVYAPTKDFEFACECIYCGLQIMQWNVNDNVYNKHRKCNRFCVLFNSVSNIGFDVVD